MACFKMAKLTSSLKSSEISPDEKEEGKLTSESPFVDTTTILENSEKFPIPFPIESVRCSTLLKSMKGTSDIESQMKENINRSYPVIHEKTLWLIQKFLLHKCTYGSSIEKELYKSMTIAEFITRLLTKRAVEFLNSGDSYLLISGKRGHGGWEKIGTPQQSAQLDLKDCLSYDEIKISALVAASSPSFFINDGDRYNQGVRGKSGNYQKWGIVIGAVGCRFEKSNFMEWQDMVITEKQNLPQNGYGQFSNIYDFKTSIYSNRADWMRIWAEFYDIPYFDIWDPSKFTSKHLPLHNGVFSASVFKQRCKILAQTILLEANERCDEKKQKVFLHVVGFGLGVWRISSCQEGYFVDAFVEAIAELNLPGISDVYFRLENKTAPNVGKIKLHFGKRNPHGQLKWTDSNKLLVVTYAWDGNALPGNEFWGGSLSASGDPAQACSSQIAELQNAHINPKMSGANVMIASPTLGKLVTLVEFEKNHMLLNN